MVNTPSQPGAITQSTLSGSEIVSVNNGPVWTTVTTRQIADLGGQGQTTEIVNTSITTVGAGTLTAAGLVGGLITRTGPVAAYTDTTDTSANIITAIGAFVSGATFVTTIKNATAFVQTLSAGTGVTLPLTNVLGPFQETNMFGTIGGTSASPTVTFTHMGTGSISDSMSITTPQITAINTVGAGVITAAAINGGNLARTGTQTVAFTDTTDTATAIVAGNPGLIGKIGASFIFYYGNTTTWPVTLTGGTGVTVSNITVIPAGSVAAYLITQTAANTLTMVGIGVTQSVSTAVSIAGATSGEVTLIPTAISGQNTLTLPAVTGTVASTTGSNLYVPDLKRTTSSVTANGTTTYANVTGLSFTVVPGTYQFDCYLPSTVASGTGGIKYAFNYTTAVLSVLQATGVGSTSAASAIQQTQTTTTQTDIFTQAAVVINTVIKGTMVVTTGGTVDIQVAQNTSNASNTIALLGGYAQFTRIA